MKKRVIDVYPPSEELKKEENQTTINQKNFRGRRWFLTALFLLVAFSVYFCYSSYRTEVVIKPVSEKVEENREAVVRASGSVGEGEVRGMIFSEKTTGSKDFVVEETEIVEAKTRGEIEICQDYTQSTTNYRKGTRFISDGGKLFEAEEAFSIPGMSENEGCGMVEVVAAEEGKDYNISENSNFVLPGLEGTTIYGRVKGVSFVLREEGFVKEVPYLDDGTIEKAEEEIKNKLVEEAKEKIMEQYGEDYFIKEEAQYKEEIIDKSFKENEDGETFSYELQVRVEVMTISKEEVTEFIYKALPEGFTWQKGKEEIEIDFKRVNFNEKEADIVVEFAMEIYERIDEEKWKRELAGLSFKEAEEKIKSSLDVEEINIRNFPFGLREISKDRKRIKILLDFDTEE